MIDSHSLVDEIGLSDVKLVSDDQANVWDIFGIQRGSHQMISCTSSIAHHGDDVCGHDQYHAIDGEDNESRLSSETSLM